MIDIEEEEPLLHWFDNHTHQIIKLSAIKIYKYYVSIKANNNNTMKQDDCGDADLQS